jgi:hypothetical protein
VTLTLQHSIGCGDQLGCSPCEAICIDCTITPPTNQHHTLNLQSYTGRDTLSSSRMLPTSHCNAAGWPPVMHTCKIDTAFKTRVTNQCHCHWSRAGQRVSPAADAMTHVTSTTAYTARWHLLTAIISPSAQHQVVFGGFALWHTAPHRRHATCCHTTATRAKGSASVGSHAERTLYRSQSTGIWQCTWGSPVILMRCCVAQGTLHAGSQLLLVCCTHLHLLRQHRCHVSASLHLQQSPICVRTL